MTASATDDPLVDDGWLRPFFAVDRQGTVRTWPTPRRRLWDSTPAWPSAGVVTGSSTTVHVGRVAGGRPMLGTVFRCRCRPDKAGWSGVVGPSYDELAPEVP